MTEPRTDGFQGPHGPALPGTSRPVRHAPSPSGASGAPGRRAGGGGLDILLIGLFFVPVSSFLGLLMVMFNSGPQAFVAVWSANVWGSLVFGLGTLFSFYVCVRFMEDRISSSRSGSWSVLVSGAVFVGFVTLFVYALSWGFSWQSFLLLKSGTDLAFLWSGDLLSSVVMWGWPGMVGMAVVMPWAALRVLRISLHRAAAPV